MSEACQLLRVAESPVLFAVPELASSAECASLRALVDDPAALAAFGAPLEPSPHGASCELPVDAVPLLQTLKTRIEALLGIRNEMGDTFRLRVYDPGQGHPPHLDEYVIGDTLLVATVLLCVEAPLAGGQTVFTRTPEGPLVAAPREGHAVVWYNVGPDAQTAASSRHLAAPVLAGRKAVLGYFVYAEPRTAARLSRGQRASEALRATFRTVPADQRGVALRGHGRKLTLIDDGVPEETISLLRHSAEARGVAVQVLEPRSFDFSANEPLPDGSLLFRPAISLQASRVEQALWQPKVATFLLDPDGPLVSNIAAHETFLRAGLPVPRMLPLVSTDRTLQRAYVEALGGLPVVVKALGYSRGVGTIRVDSLASLFSVVDFMLTEGTKPFLCAYIPDAVHWRLVVVGDQVVSTYRNVNDEDDFRTSGSDELEDYAATPPPGMAELAVASCVALRHGHGGVDVLWHPSGRMYLLESNFPCYYAQSQLKTGVDISGAMLDWLLDRADALAGPVSA